MVRSARYKTTELGFGRQIPEPKQRSDIGIRLTESDHPWPLARKTGGRSPVRRNESKNKHPPPSASKQPVCYWDIDVLTTKSIREHVVAALSGTFADRGFHYRKSSKDWILRSDEGSSQVVFNISNYKPQFAVAAILLGRSNACEDIYDRISHSSMDSIEQDANRASIAIAINHLAGVQARDIFVKDENDLRSFETQFIALLDSCGMAFLRDSATSLGCHKIVNIDRNSQLIETEPGFSIRSVILSSLAKDGTIESVIRWRRNILCNKIFSIRQDFEASLSRILCEIQKE